LLALRHRAALLRVAQLVHPHDRGEGQAPRGERQDRLAPVDDPERPLRRLAGEQHRLGPLAQPLLGHSPADLALRGGAPDVRRFARGARRAGRSRPLRLGPAPAVRRRRHA